MSVGTIFLGGRYRSELDNGLPNVGGQLWTYAAGTTTFQTTYVDSGLLTPGTYQSDGFGGLYIVLDARGESQVWLGDSPYRFVEKTASGTVISVTDGIQSIAGQIATAIAAAVAGLPSVVNIPTGGIIMWPASSVPAGFLKADFSEISRTAFAGLNALAAAAGYANGWGPGNGSTTFNVFDMRRCVAVGSGGTGTAALGNTVGSVGGAETHVLTVAEMPAHDHQGSDATDEGHTHGYHDPLGGSDPPQCNASTNTSDSGASTGVGYANITVTIASQGGGTAFSLLQSSRVVTMLIKT